MLRSGMRASDGIEDYLSSPVGAWVAGRSYLFWCQSPQFFGFSLWGRHDVDDARHLVQLIDMHMRAEPPLDIVTDVRRVTTPDVGSFQLAVDYCRVNLPEQERLVRRHAIIRPEGVIGAITAGFYRLIDPKHNWQVFTSAPEAFAWLRPAEGLAVCTEVDEIVASRMGMSEPIRLLRHWLQQNLSTCSLNAAARAAGMSRRSLQRLMGQTGTSFRAEVELARVHAAKAMLVERDRKLDAIASELGWSSLAHFSTRFRHLTGETPSEFRNRHANQPKY